MRWFSVSLPVVAAVLLGLVATGGMRTAAQEATPAAGPNFVAGQLSPIGEQFELIPGVDVEFLNEGPTAQAPGQSLILYRVTLRGGEVPSHIHPGTTVLAVESGAMSWTLQAGTVTVTRPGAAPETVTTPGTEIVVNAGEGLAYNADVVHSARAAGAEPAVVLLAFLVEAGQPVVTVTDEHGTPTA
jgi:quercetin dioxygenase-like cupin family protein